MIFMTFTIGPNHPSSSITPLLLHLAQGRMCCFPWRTRLPPLHPVPIRREEKRSLANLKVTVTQKVLVLSVIFQSIFKEFRVNIFHFKCCFNVCVFIFYISFLMFRQCFLYVYNFHVTIVLKCLQDFLHNLLYENVK